MANKRRKRKASSQTRFSFGSASALITNLGIIAGLHSQSNARIGIIGGILVIALADNIADSFGIHIFQESQKIKTIEIWISTLSNFLIRVLVSFSFVLIMLAFQLNLAIAISICWGLFLLAAISYLIARDEGINPLSSVMTHVVIALIVIFLSNLVGDFILAHIRT